MTTAIIPHPTFFRPPLDPSPCIENEGPRNLEFSARVRTYHGAHIGLRAYGERDDVRDHYQRSPRQLGEWDIDQKSMRRALALLGTLNSESPQVTKVIAEIRRRIITTHPFAETTTDS